MTEPLRVRLTKTHTVKQIATMIRDLENDPDSRVNNGGIEMYRKSVNKKIDEMGWAIYSLQKKDNPGSVMHIPELQLKNW